MAVVGIGRMLQGSAAVGDTGRPDVVIGSARLTPRQWLICAIAALGFAFDLYEVIVWPLVLRPALASLAGLNPASTRFNSWVGLLFYVPLACGGVFGFLGGYLTDLLGRRRVLVWSILLYAFSACATAYATTLPEFLMFRCATVVGVCVEYVAGITWLAELFPNPRQRESILGYTQAAFGFGGLLATATYYLAVTYSERLPALRGSHEAWRYTLLSGLVPAIPLLLTRPFLPESQVWIEKKLRGTLQRPSVRELFHPTLRRTTLMSMALVACSYALASGVILHTPRMVPGLPELHGMSPRQVEQTVSSVQLFQELGTITGRLIFVVLVIRIATQRALLRIFLIPGLVVFAWVYFFAAVHSLALLKIGIFLAGLFLNAVFSFWGNYLPRMYPTHLRGTGESFSLNIGARLLGPFAAIGTTQLVNVMPGSGPAVRLAYSAGIIAVLAYSASLIGSLWLSEPEHAQLPE
jgi:MFS family permease